ncbi:MAG: DUF3098 domain-containing protein [Flavobacteriales bacterium]|jgi:membrane-bound ClpP family serine protease|nr:DUF3098 domain-containing protein [Flavobacteriales bacterium]
MSAEQQGERPLIFGKENYMFLAIGFVLVVIGFILMSGGASENPAVFNPEVFSFRRITLAPIVVIVGFGFVMYAIFHKKRNK